MSERVFGLVDCNSFYCSCERVFDARLKKRAVIVLSNNDGCAIARTQEAKDLGIKMGAPYHEIKKLCQKNNVAVFSANFATYTNLSDRVMRRLDYWCPKIQVYSIDEAFVDLTGIKDLTDYARKIREDLLTSIGIPTGIGLGPTKVLAKLANHLAKKSQKAQGVVNLMHKPWRQEALKRVDIADVWGIGSASAQKLRLLGIQTAYDFTVYRNERLIQKILTKVGLQIKHELMGINCFEFEQDIAKKKEIMSSRSFGKPVTSQNDLKEAVANYLSLAAKKMRAQNSLCTHLSVYARTNPFRNVDQFTMYERFHFNNPTQDSRKLIKVAMHLIDRGFKAGHEYAKAGVCLSHFYEHNEYQIDFLSEHDDEKSIRLMQLIDQINRQQGYDLLKIASCGTSEKAWKMRQDFLSPKYMSDWKELKEFY